MFFREGFHINSLEGPSLIFELWWHFSPNVTESKWIVLRDKLFESIRFFANERYMLIVLGKIAKSSLRHLKLVGKYEAFFRNVFCRRVLLTYLESETWPRNKAFIHDVVRTPRMAEMNDLWNCKSFDHNTLEHNSFQHWFPGCTYKTHKKYFRNAPKISKIRI